MKKIYLSALALSIGSLSFAQNARLELNAESGIKHTLQNEKAPGDIIWSEDFSGGFPAGWTTGGADGASWIINTLDLNPTNYPPSTYTDVTAIASTSGGNHMLFFGENITPVVDRDAYFQTTAIALTGQPNITVRFEQKFRLCCGNNIVEALNLVVSTDPTFPVGATTQEFNVINGIPINAQSPDPFVTSVNITSIAGGHTGDIYMRFHWAVGLSHYYWMIDDIEVLETPLNDLVAFDAYYGSLNVPYTRIPVSQIQPIDFAMQAENAGVNTQTGTIITAYINGTAEATSSPISIAPTATDSMVTTTQFTPPASPLNVDYMPSIGVSSYFTDFNPGNDTMSFPPFQISQYIYAQDDYAATPGNGGGEDGNNPGSFEFEAGNYYDVVANADAYGIDVFIGSNAVANEEVDAVLYRVSAITGIFVEVARSPVLITAATDAGTLHQFRFASPTALTADSSYFAAVHSLGNTDFSYGVSGRSASNDQAGGPTSLIYYPNMSSPATGQNYFVSRTPMVRLNFDPSAVGINDIAANNVSFNVYPNPSTGEFNINLNNNMGSAVSLTVKNIVGQTIINKEIAINGNQVETISLVGYDKGIYFLTINNETVKLIVE